MKRFFRILGAVFLVLFGSFCALVLVCAWKPEVTQALANFLYPNRQASVSGEDAFALGEDASGEDASDEAGDFFLDAEGAANGDFDGKNRVQETFSLGDPQADGMSGAAALAPEIPRAEGIAESVNPEYVSPQVSDIQVPAQVSGKSGYRQIQDEGGQIGDEEASQLQSQLGVGATGDGLVFDGNYYPYYGMLDEAGKHLYRQIYANANDLIMAFAPEEEVTAQRLRTVFSAVYNDHPELFWLETAYSGKYRRDGICVEIALRMNYTAQNLENSKAVFNEKANEILAQAASLSDNYAKEKLVHDALIDRITYNMGAEMNQSAYSALVNGQTVCAGYARAFQYLLQQLGIPCYYCTGYAGESHAWNIVSLDDGYYNVDTTWDDTEGGNYDYFNKTDQDYGRTHVRQELSVYLPPCNGQRYRNLEPESGAANPAQGTGEMAGANPEQSMGNMSETNPAGLMADGFAENPDNTVVSDPEDRLRDIQDVGVNEADILSSVSDYYEDCHEQVAANGLGSYTFSSVVDGKVLAEEIYQSYRRNTYRQGYMEQAMAEVGALTCAMELEFEPLKGDKYLVTHTVNLKP